MIALHGFVSEFHEAFDIAPDDHNKAGRWRLIREEVLEVKKALDAHNRLNLAQELADLVYVSYGTALVFGISLDTAVKEVHRANMSKLGRDGKPIKDPVSGKVLKGPNYRPPNLSGALRIPRAPEGVITWD